ncbi:EamA family transporter [Tsukamurella paurometabola]|uniref:Inner membrane transporter rhtA n=2 Tax=Tsukamurella paurometabola TaxID=2061 RepID=A0A3P8L9S8_TSUPA|nr:EamA family transporter [Tsukamurella paurometabola]UEA85504.1 EamA family transporter [Tsukamurella paurometabola]VDR41091.1 Inner membrane transporter rhtA [Tsukamurella paurometabola]
MIPAMFVIGAISQYVGASLGVGLFEQLSPVAVAWLRGAGAGLILLLALRPRRRDWTPARLRAAALFGTVTVAMNMAFYEAIDHIDLGTAVAIEFLGPIAVAVAGSRRSVDLIAAGAALAGVVCVAGVNVGGVAGSDGAVGVACALLAAGLWAGYIVLGKRVADAGGGIEGLGVGLAAGALVLALPGLGPDLVTRPEAFLSWQVWILGLGLGLLSSVVPYALDQVVLTRVGRERFALLLALLPVTAAGVGAVMLGQRPGWLEAVGIALVVIAIALTSRRTPAPDERAFPGT